MLRPLSTLPLSNTAILELGKSACQYVDDVKNAAPDLAKKYERILSEQAPVHISALDLWHEELRQDHLTTFCDALDNILDGGFQCREITEICGAYGSGKSQICMQMSIVTQLPKECGGLNSQSLYIDTRNGFSPTRIQDVLMGVRGLSTYVDNRRSELLEQYKLHGGYIVIDGESLAIALYSSSRHPGGNEVRANCTFGGDYNIYVGRVKEFFDNLEKCKVTPLVIMDGGWEEQKMKTLVSRRERKLQTAMNYTSAQHSQQMFLPVNLILAFTTYLLQRGTKIVRCIFENDPCIAGVAKILNCPVLSSDSDFYIFGVKYIPYTTLRLKPKQMDDGRHVMYCNIFEVENLLRLFPGLDHSVLTLLAVLLGNDYVNAEIFQNFFENLKNQCHLESLDDFIMKINVLLTWLSERKINLAVAAILSTLPEQYRQKVLDSIELIVNGYIVLPFDMLKPLGFASEYPRERIATCQQKRYVFPGNISTLGAQHYWREYKINSIPNLGDVETELPFNMQSDLGNRSQIFADHLPVWFQQFYKNTEFPSFFITMMFHRLFVCAIQIEDPAKPCAEAMSLNLFRVIDGLLVAGREEAYRDLTYVIRDGTRFVTHKVSTVRGINSIDFPALSKLPYKHPSLRKQIFDTTLEISGKESLIEDIPPEWRLFVIAALYWIDPEHEPPPNTCHIYALLFTMLLGVVEEKFHQYRALNNHKPTYKISNKEIKEARRIDPNAVKKEQRRNTRRKDETNNGNGHSISKALQAVTVGDCLQAVGLFLKNCGLNEIPLVDNTHDFDVTIVHKFSQFQSCLRHTMYLNALLGYPYKQPVIEKLFNGTMLYNLYIQFEKHLDVESHISEILGKTPSLLRLLNLLIHKMKMLVDRPIANGYRDSARGRRKTKANKKKTKANTVSENEEMLYENQTLSEQEQSDESNESNVEDKKIFTPKARKLLNTDCSSGVHVGRGVTKRKNKKKRSNQLLDDYGVSEDFALPEKSLVCRRLPKSYSRFRKFDITQSLD